MRVYVSQKEEALKIVESHINMLKFMHKEIENKVVDNDPSKLDMILQEQLIKTLAKLTNLREN